MVATIFNPLISIAEYAERAENEVPPATIIVPDQGRDFVVAGRFVLRVLRALRV
jgi:hypothetical protein